MTQKDITGYLNEYCQDKLKSISDLSASNDEKRLIEDDREQYSFDLITEEIYAGRPKPTSADALFVSSDVILLTEFKSGFKRKISKRNLDEKKLACPEDERKVCRYYGEMLLKKNNLEVNELLDSLKMKVAESYVVLEKNIFPICTDFSEGEKARIIFCVVVDDVLDSMEDTLLELAGTTSVSNIISSIKASLSRFVGLKSADGKDYYYDGIEVMSPHEYKIYINRYIKDFK